MMELAGTLHHVDAETRTWHVWYTVYLAKSGIEQLIS